jgi:enediyne biosynthesis thioesterase
MRSYEYRHVVSFEETNLVGNVYYVNHIRWQGICREMFLRDHAPDVLRDLNNGLSLVTVHCSCHYLAEVFAFDEIVVRMRLTELSQNRITMAFECTREGASGTELVARGEQQIVSMRREGDRSASAPIPTSLRDALRKYAGGD